ncbi:MAG: hypothetical protein K6F94_07360 [Bacteroidaceae bacterium]|nr:hypothetical protein [Bacteroidaceae bacterium]
MLLPLIISLYLASDTTVKDTMRTDTMREVTIYSPQGLPVKKAIDRSLKKKREGETHIPTVSDIINKLSPTLNDKILHPFAFNDRKREKRRKKRLLNLDHFEKLKTFNELLMDAYIEQMREDSIEKAKQQ